MKSTRQARRISIRKNQAHLSGEVQIYDLTVLPAGAGITETAEAMPPLPAAARADENRVDDLVRRPYSFEKIADILSWSAMMMAESPVAAALWESACKAGWQIGLADLHNDGFHMDAQEKKVLLDNYSMTPSALGRSTFFRNAFLIGLARALRDIWHEDRNEPFERHYGPENALMLERIRAADGDTAAALACWEWRAAGHGEAWRHLLGSQEGDMALVFSRYLERNPAGLFDGAALAYAFRQWYTDHERVDGCDHETLEALDDILLASGAPDPFGKKILEAEAVEALSQLPDGSRYLNGLGGTILKDPFFCGLNDPINQAHLFHLVYDTEVTMVNNVPFRDRNLARKIFPSGSVATEGLL